MDSILTGEQVRAHLQEVFSRGLSLAHDTEEHLAGALKQTLRHPGSMVRAELAYRAARSFSQSHERAESLAIAVEYFHTASLLFDDLPSMDNARERRGAPCVHRVHGEGAAILAALGLINRAYALVWKAVAGLPAEVQERGLAYLERNLGIAGVLNGQSQDLHYTELPSCDRVPQQIALGKTVSLIRIPLVLPAILGGATNAEVRRLECLAVYWGLSYQAVDDLRDVLFPDGQTGKSGARDAHLNRPNQALTDGVAGAFERAGRLMRLGRRVIAGLAHRRTSLAFLAESQWRFESELAALSDQRLAFSL
jgi:geranylgeranyl diphosphate synthase, type II